jgi:CDP-glucose 4,6-dehydratase
MRADQISLVKKTYAGKKVLLTGHTGFKGSWLLKWLNMLGADVKGYALAPDPEFSLYTQLNGNALADSVIADLGDASRVRDEILSFCPDFVFHLGAQSLVRLSYDLPLETFGTNVMGTAHVLDALRALNNSCTAVMITTDKVYENRESMEPYHETEPLGGKDPYSASKAACELVISSYRNSFFSPEKFNQHRKAIASARSGNVIGGGDWALDRIIPDLVRAFSKGETLNIRNPESIRPWQHVLEPLGGYLLLGARLAQQPDKFSGAWNFGPGKDDTLRVKDLVTVAKKFWEGSVEYPNLENQPHEASLLRLDTSKAVEQLSWSPLYSSNEGIELTIQWYRAVMQRNESPTLWVESQITAYERG